MIIHDLDVLRTELGPSKNNPPSIVDADRMAALPIAFQWLKAIARRRGEIAKHSRSIQLNKLATRGLRKIGWESPWDSSFCEDRPGELSLEASEPL